MLYKTGFFFFLHWDHTLGHTASTPLHKNMYQATVAGLALTALFGECLFGSREYDSILPICYHFGMQWGTFDLGRVKVGFKICCGLCGLKKQNKLLLMNRQEGVVGK